MFDNFRKKRAVRAALKKQRFFEAWLLSKPENICVGLARDGVNCPIAQYIHETVNVGMVVVAYGNADLRLPPWVHHFIRLIDASTEREISRDVALYLLEKVWDL